MQARKLVVLAAMWSGCQCGANNVSGLHATLVAKPTAIDFGNVDTGTSATAGVSLSVDGNRAVRVKSVAIAGESSLSSELSQDGKPTTVEVGAADIVHVTFAPTRVGEVHDALIVQSDADGDSATLRIPIQGNGVGCQPGATRTVSCGNCGSQTDTCSSSFQWNSGSCTGEGACAPGATQACGNCGTETCSASCGWGSCATEGGACTPGAEQSCNTYGSQTCSSSCGWGSCSCPTPPVCTPGAVQSSTACAGGCGELTTTCDSCGQWGTSVCTPLSAGTLCRAAVGVCDENEYCDGESTSCPSDALVPSGTICRASTGPCDPAERCTGQSAICPADVRDPTTTVCRASTGPCDPAEYCTGTSGICPTDVFSATTIECRAASGTCETPAFCTGTSGTCPASTFKPSSVVCHPPTGDCDEAEYCTGTSGSCPEGAYYPSGYLCRAASSCESAGYCTGTSATCPSGARQGCSPGTVQACGNCGTQTCSDSCTWGSCVGEGVCTPNDTQTCNIFGAQTCTSSCAWGSCSCQGDCCPDGQARNADDACCAPLPTDACQYECDVDVTAGTSTCDASHGVTVQSLTAGGYGTMEIDLGSYVGSSSATCSAAVPCANGQTCVNGVCEGHDGGVQFDLTANNPQGYWFHLADSPTCNGWGGDGGQFSNDAEIQLLNTTLSLFGTDGNNGADLGDSNPFVPASGLSTRSIWVADEVVQSFDPCYTVNSPYALRLNAPDPEGAPDALWYVGLNGVYSGESDRRGSGLTKVHLCIR